MIAGSPLPRKFEIAAPSGSALKVLVTKSVPSFFRMTNVLPAVGVNELIPVRIKSPPSVTVPLTANWSYCVPTVVPPTSMLSAPDELCE